MTTMKTTDKKIRKLLLYEYTKVLLNDSFSLSNAFFSNGVRSNHHTALEVYRHAFELFLHWTPEEVAAYINKEILTKMKIYDLLKFIQFPTELNKVTDLDYIAHLLYPTKIPYNPEKLVIRTYKDVMNKTLYKFPKKYFDGLDGRKRACICLSYLTELKHVFKTAQEGYAYYASGEGRKELDNNALKNVWRSVFLSPVLFYHESLPERKKDEFWFHYYEVMFEHEEELIKLRGESL